MMRRAVASALGAVLLAGACSGTRSDGPAAISPTSSTEATTTTTGAATSSTVTPPALGGVEVGLTEVGRLDQPIAMAWCPADTQPYVAEKGGKVRRLAGTTELDLSRQVSTGSEQGLLGIACDDDGTFYASYTDRKGDSQLDQFRREASGRIELAGAHLLVTKQPAPNHNGGNIAFGPDGQLWYGLGDGGGHDDQFGNAQEAGDRLGSIMRLQPVNPRPEIMVKGVRNPWRWSFDRLTGDLWIGDVGQGRIEEIDKLAAGQIKGANLGWPAFEGTQRQRNDVAAPADARPPVFEYPHGVGQAVVGGYVYRGEAIPSLRGAYLYADNYKPELRAIVVEGSRIVDQRVLAKVPGGLPSSFAQDPAGELYVLSLHGGVYRIDPR